MSVMSVLKKDLGGGKRSAPAAQSAPAAAVPGAPMPVLQGHSFADLMPTEIHQRRRDKKVRRGVMLSVVAVAVIVVAAAGVSVAHANSEAARLQSAQQDQAQLRQKLAAYGPDRALQSRIALLDAARKVGGAEDIDWATYITRLQDSLPSGVALTNVTVKSSDAHSQFEQATVPEATPRVAEVTFTASSQTLPVIPTWVDGLSTMPGYISAAPTGVTKGTAGYSATITMDVSAAAYSRSYVSAKEMGK